MRRTNILLISENNYPKQVDGARPEVNDSASKYGTVARADQCRLDWLTQRLRALKQLFKSRIHFNWNVSCMRALEDTESTSLEASGSVFYQESRTISVLSERNSVGCC